MFGRTDGDVVIVEPEVDLVAWFDAELVSQLLRNDNLAFGAHAMSHTTQYDLRAVDRYHRTTRVALNA